MHKIWHWFRGENDPKSDEFWQGAGGDKRRWQSSMIARTASGVRRSRKKKQGREADGRDAEGQQIVQNFDAIHAASTSSPAVMGQQQQQKWRTETGQKQLEMINENMGQQGQEGRSRKKRGTEKRREVEHARDYDQIPTTHHQPQNGTTHAQKRSNKNSGGTATMLSPTAATTEDIPQCKRPFDSFRVEKKSVSANEMMGVVHSGSEKHRAEGGFLHRIRQRFSKRQPKRAKAEEPEETGASPEETMRVITTMGVEASGKNVNEGQEGARHGREEYRLMSGGAGDALGEDEAASQGRCSSFDYFSATASPTDQPLIDRDPRFDEDGNGPCFATAAEARAYLRSQKYAGQKADEAAEEGDSEGEEFDADDEITTMTTSAMCDSQLTAQRPHSAMECAAGQRESVYFTATVVVQSATPETERRRNPAATAEDSPQHRAHQKYEFSRQKSNSQLILGQEDHVAVTGGQGSEPGSTKLGRRRLRFVIPQVSICSVEGTSAADAANNNSIESNDQKENNGQIGDENNNNGEEGQQMRGGDEMSEQDKQLRKALCEMDRRELTLAQRRQSNMDVVHQASGRRTSTTLIPLTSAQIHLIRSLWRQVYLSKGPTVIGSQISHRLFFKEPEIRELFRRCPLPSQFANHDSFSKAHCKRISEIIDQVVECLDDLETVGPVLERIGRCHAHVSSGQLSSKLWNSAAETFIDCTLEWGDRRARSETVRKAWALIVAFMVERIKHGHLEERRHITAIRSTIASLERVASSSGAGGGDEWSVAASSAISAGSSSLPYSDYYHSVIQPPPISTCISSSIQLPLPSTTCPIRRVSAYAAAPANGAPPGGGGGARKSAGDWTPPEQKRTLPRAMAANAAAASVSPYMNRRKHHHHRSEKDKNKSQQSRPQRSSSSSAHHSPKTGSVGSSRRKLGAPTSVGGSRTQQRTTAAPLPLNSAPEGRQWSDV